MREDDDGDYENDVAYDCGVVEGDDEDAVEVEDEYENDGDDFGTNDNASARGIDNHDDGNSMPTILIKTKHLFIVMIMTMMLYVVLMIMMMIRVGVLPLSGCILPSGFRRDSNLIILQVWWFHFNAYTVYVDASIIHPGFVCFSP